MSLLDSSQDMFEDSNVTEENISNEPAWRGVSLEEIKKISIFEHFLPIHPSQNHQVLFKLPLVDGCNPVPYPETYSDAWDTVHVRMPHSRQNLFPTSQCELKPRWSLVKEALSKPINSSSDLENAIFSYNSKNGEKWSLDALHKFFSKTLLPEESSYFFSNILPGIIKLALEIETAFKGNIIFLKKGESRSISMSQEQAAILLANAFLSTFPRRNSPSQYTKYPTINFNRLFQCGSFDSVQEKLKCFINYFRRVGLKRPNGVITFSRKRINPNNLPIWSSVKKGLPKMYISSEGTIEDEGSGLIEIDFANKFIGGGVLGRGSVQEEIKFLICPELVVARLFTEVLDDTEALIVTGCERYNSYEGYGDSFSWSKNFVDKTKRDKWRRIESLVVAIDALYFADPLQQYSRESINRELNKAYAGFSIGGSRGSGIATGNWGCGVFRGDPRLKSLLQLMAAAVSGKTIAYFTFGDETLRDDVHQMWKFLLETSTSVGSLWNIISCYKQEREEKNVTLYEHIYETVCSLQGVPKEISYKEDKSNNCLEEKLNEEEIELMNSKGKSDMKELTKEPMSAETCSLTTDEGRKKCLETEAARWQAYRTAINGINLPKSQLIKRKISDYFQKVDK